MTFSLKVHAVHDAKARKSLDTQSKSLLSVPPSPMPDSNLDETKMKNDDIF